MQEAPLLRWPRRNESADYLAFLSAVVLALALSGFAPGGLEAEPSRSFSNQGTPSLSVRFKNVAVVNTMPVRLADLGQVQSSVPSLKDKIVFQNLSEPFYLSDDRLKEALLQSGGIESKVYGTGIWVIPLTENMSASETGQFFEGILENSIKGQGTYRIEASKGMQYNSSLHSLIRISGLHVDGAGKRNITVDVMDPQEKKRILFRQTIPIRVLKKILVPVAQKDLKFGQTIREGDYTLEERYTDGKLKDYSGQNIHGWKLNAPVRKGEVLQSPAIQEIPDIRRGQSLDLIYQKPGLVLKIRCVAYRDGNIGESIPVRILSFQNKSIIKQGKIVSDRSVVYEP
ncbi:MAG: flagellar basal body P-ring formation protein FlgA [Leptospiraceae bacterium]|nr:flagellar basal body P-ring formation protein FlgA [Leptospiraceae bacterium]